MTAWREVTKRKRTWNEANYVLTKYDDGLAVIPSYNWNWNPNNISDYELRLATQAIRAVRISVSLSLNSRHMINSGIWLEIFLLIDIHFDLDQAEC